MNMGVLLYSWSVCALAPVSPQRLGIRCWEGVIAGLSASCISYSSSSSAKCFSCSFSSPSTLSEMLRKKWK